MVPCFFILSVQHSYQVRIWLALIRTFLFDVLPDVNHSPHTAIYSLYARIKFRNQNMIISKGQDINTSPFYGLGAKIPNLCTVYCLLAKADMFCKLKLEGPQRNSTDNNGLQLISFGKENNGIFCSWNSQNVCILFMQKFPQARMRSSVPVNLLGEKAMQFAW